MHSTLSWFQSKIYLTLSHSQFRPILRQSVNLYYEYLLRTLCHYPNQPFWPPEVTVFSELTPYRKTEDTAKKINFKPFKFSRVVRMSLNLIKYIFLIWTGGVSPTVLGSDTCDHKLFHISRNVIMVPNSLIHTLPTNNKLLTFEFLLAGKIYDHDHSGIDEQTIRINDLLKQSSTFHLWFMNYEQ